MGSKKRRERTFRISVKKEWAKDFGQSSLKRDKKQTVSSNKYLVGEMVKDQNGGAGKRKEER